MESSENLESAPMRERVRRIGRVRDARVTSRGRAVRDRTSSS